LRVYPVISVTNNSTVISDQEVEQIRAAIQHQVSYHFKPFWDSGANLQFTGKTPIPNTWELAFLDNSDQAEALGYHYFVPGGKPVMKVFAKTDIDYGYKASVTAGHEVLEALADPYINLAAQTSDTEFYGYEVGDPVEADALGYEINVGTKDAPVPITCTNFVLPLWFVPETADVPNTRWDYTGHLTAPLQLAEGGYFSKYTAGYGWGQYQNKNGEMVQVPLEVDNPRFRPRG